MTDRQSSAMWRADQRGTACRQGGKLEIGTWTAEEKGRGRGPLETEMERWPSA